MKHENASKNSSQMRLPRDPALVLLLLVALLGVLFWHSFLPAWTQFANDGPLGAMMSERARMPEPFLGTWGNLNGYGIREPSAVPNATFSLNWLLGGLGFSKFYPPLALLILGLGAWFFIQQLGLGALAALLGGLAAALSPDFFSVACWGVGSQAICFGMNYLALGILVSPWSLRPWIRYPLAGLAVGMGVMEGADIGAIFSVVTAIFVVVHAWITCGKPVKGVLQGSVRVAVIALFAGFIAVAAVSSLVSTQIKGVAGAQQDQRSKEERWDWATQWSYPKAETLGIVMPGLFGYLMDTPDGGAYWGKVGRDPSWDRYFASRQQAAPPRGAIRYGGGSGYAGVLVVLTALWALLQSFRKEHSVFTLIERRWVWFLSGVILVSLLLSYGRFAPFYQFFYALPYASTIRNPVKFLHVFQWALVVLFAFGVGGLSRRYLKPVGDTTRGLVSHWQAWWRTASRFDRNWVKGLALAVAVGVVAWILYVSSRSKLVAYLLEVQFDAETANAIASFSFAQVGWFILLLSLAGVLFAVILSGYFSGPRARVVAVLLGLFVVVDLARVGSHWVNPYNWKERYLEPANNAVFQLLRQKPHENRVAIWPFGLPGQFGIVQQVYQTEWLQHLFQYYNIQSLDIIQMPRMPEDIAAYEGALAYDNTTNTLHRVVRRWELANLRYLIGPVGLHQALNKELDPQQRFRPVMLFEFYQTHAGGRILTQTNATGPFAVFEFTGALPRAKLYSQWQVSTNDDATLTQLAAKDFNPAQTVLVAEPLPAPKEGAINVTGKVEFKSYAPKRIVLGAQAESPSVLLLNDKHDPNWQVLVDGKPAPLLRCNYIMRGVFLEPGEHTVEFQFRPPVDALYVSLGAIALGLVLVGFAVADGRRRPATKTVPGNKPA